MEERTIDISNDYKPQIKEDISTSDVFFEQYRTASDILENILSVYASIKDKKDSNYNKIEYPNNVIAFCGERGDGKTSMLLSFMNLLRKYKDGKNTANDLFANKDNINKIIFANEIYVDPSALDGVHNILDLLVAKMFKKFKSSLKYDNGKNDAEQQQRLLKSFQMVYRLISIVKDSKKILDDEFDYEGSVDKLSSLSDSMRLKEELINLINTYNDCMNNGDKNVVIPILIDDIDMSFSHAYAMSEQLRKFLIIPGIVIILSVRIDQLLYCIKESNIRQLEWLAKKNYYSEMRGEIANMSSNYLSKLLPLAHRVNLPKVQDLRNVKITYNKNDYSLSSLSIFALQKIYQKTGMVFVLGDDLQKSILPNSFRDMVNFIGFMDLLPDFSDKNGNDGIKFSNICHFFDFYFKTSLNNIKSKINSTYKIESIFDLGINVPKVAVEHIIKAYERFGISPSNSIRDDINGFANQAFPEKNSFCYLMNSISYINRNIYHNAIGELIEIIKLFYTVNLHQINLQNKMTSREQKTSKVQDDERKVCLATVTGTTIWGYSMNNNVPAARLDNINKLVQRARFEMQSIDVFNCIAQELNLPESCYLNGSYISKFTIESPEDRRNYIVAWLLFLILSNSYYIPYGNVNVINGCGYLIYDNSVLIQYVQVSIENLIVRFSMLSELVELLNVDILGFSEDEFQNVVKDLLEQNDSAVKMSELIVCNVDLIQSIYSLPQVRYKKKADEPERTEKCIEKFLQQINTKMNKIKKEYKYDFSFSDNTFINFRYGNEEGKIINIPNLYAKLFAKALSFFNTNNTVVDISTQKDIDEFSSYLDGKNVILPVKIKRYSQYTTAHSKVETLKANLLSLAKTIGMYVYLSNDYDYIKPESRTGLINLYERVCKICKTDPSRLVSKELGQEYRIFTDMYKYDFLSSKIQELSVANENK